MSENLKAPFPWFGGKSKVADSVWGYIGDVDNYVEPFAGSLAVLLRRPTPPKVETVNDLDNYIVNFWRALQHAPEEVAYYANNPVNEADLTARHIWLVNKGKERIEKILGDPDYYDSKVAGWWMWGISCWIGGGWCSGDGPWGTIDGKLVHLGSAGQGVNRKRVHLGDAGRGVNRQLVHLGNVGKGVNRQCVHLSNVGKGVNTGEVDIFNYLDKLAQRLRYVRVCCGDWKRVVTEGALSHGATVGIFLDPPYNKDLRDGNIYASDKKAGNITDEITNWCVSNQDNKRYRIVLAGYEGEYDLPSWEKVEWSANRAYGNSKGETANSKNRKKERLWISPNCLKNKKVLPFV